MKRRLSVWRLCLVLVIAAAVGVGVMREWDRVEPLGSQTIADSTQPWFASYVDATATPYFSFEGTNSHPADNAVIGFVTAGIENECEPAWGGQYSLDEADTSLEIDRRLARLTQLNKQFAISFGGPNNTELATVCRSQEDLQDAYRAVILRYDAQVLDLYLVDSALTPVITLQRAKALAALQKEWSDKSEPLRVWVTLPLGTSGLSQPSQRALSELLQQGVELSGVNVLAMNYPASDASLVETVTKSVSEAREQIDRQYSNIGYALSDSATRELMGITTMIGVNGVGQDEFTLENAENLNANVRRYGIRRTSMWSANRDRQCGENYPDVSQVSEFCSGVAQSPGEFAAKLADQLTGSMYRDPAETPDRVAPIPDDPKTSPYPLWDPDKAYLEGDKVVFHSSVFQAQWWNRNQVPDQPAADGSAPWHLIGPVLPGERPAPPLEVPPGLIPSWEGSVTYQGGDHVLFDGRIYEAKWWNQGDSPAAEAGMSASTPWAALDRTAAKRLIDELAASRVEAETNSEVQ